MPTFRRALERRLTRSWYGDYIAPGLRPFSSIYAGVVAARRYAYRHRVLGSGHPGVPVIVIGNLTVGGTGKTPTVIWLSNWLSERGQRVGVVSRGYGGRPATRPLSVNASTDADAAGDEPVVIARRTGVPVVVDRNRLRGARHLVAQHNVEIIIADDGLQHYRLRRDVEIALLDAERGAGNGALLPAGPLREPVTRLNDVDVRLRVGSGADITLAPPAAYLWPDGEARPLADFAHQTVLAVAGIAGPQRFFDSLRGNAIDCIPIALADHGRVDPAALDAYRGYAVLTTEKDAVKWPDNAPRPWCVRLDAQVRPSARAAIERALTQAGCLELDS